MPKKVKSSLFKNAASYSFFNILNAATPFLLIPVLTSYLSKDGYGIIAMFTIFISILNPLIGLSVNGAITRQYFSMPGEAFKKYIGNCLIIFISSVSLLLLLILIFNPFLFKLTDIPFKWLLLAVAISSFQFIYSIVLTLWQVQEQPNRYGLFQITNSVLNLLFSLYFVVVLSLNWEGRLYAWLLSSGIMACLALVILKKGGYLSFNINKDYLRHALKFSIPLIPHTIGGLIIGLSDRLIIKNVLGVGETGIYTVAFQLGSVLSILMTAFNNAYIPWLFKRLKMDDEAQKIKLVRLTYMCFGGIILLVIMGAAVNSMLTQYIIGASFMNAEKYVIFLLIAFGFNGMYLMVTNYLFYAEKTNLLARSTFIVSLVNIPMCYYLTTNYGLAGASIATILAYFFLFVSTWYLSAKVYKMPWFASTILR